MVSCWYRLPLLGKSYHCPSVQDTKAEEVVELEANSVHGPVEPSLGVVQRVALGGEHREMLDVAPRKLRTEVRVRARSHKGQKLLTSPPEQEQTRRQPQGQRRRYPSELWYIYRTSQL